ncbi:MAG TPA: hypothetical protein VKE53_12605 [Pseudolabrys sp.]|nr:hypothetical protein [Pseudolabrys sp.]
MFQSRLAVFPPTAGITTAVVLLVLDWLRRKREEPTEVAATPY